MILSNLGFFEKLYILTSLITGTGSMILGIFVLLKNKTYVLNQSYFFMSISIAAWSFSLFVCHTSGDLENALFWNRTLHLGSIFIPITFFNFTTHLLNLNKTKRKLLVLGTSLALIFSTFVYTDYFIKGIAPKFNFNIWPIPGNLYGAFLIYFSFFTYYPLWLIYKAYSISRGLKRYQLKFILIGLTIGFLGGSTNFAYFYNIQIPPVGNFFVFLYVVFLAYAIVKYRLMDITVAFTRLTIFVLVYTLVLGVPFYVGFRYPENWILPVSIMAALATAGPYVYLYLQKKAEEKLLAEQRKYQNTLRNASLGMGQIKNLNRLLKLIVHVVSRSVRILNCQIFLYHEDSQRYTLKVSKSFKKEMVRPISKDHLLISKLYEKKEPLVSFEIGKMYEENPNENLHQILLFMNEVNAEIVVPSFIDNFLIAFIVLGRKSSGKHYTQDDLSVFSILANQAGLAIENAQFYEKTRKTTEQLFKAEKMATIGTMADGLSHQINNRLHSMGFVAGDALDTLKLFQQKKQFDEETRVLVDDMRYAFERIQDNVKRGGEVVGGLLRYSRKGAEGITPVDLNELINTSVEMAQFKVKFNQFKFVRHFNGNLPKIRGNFTQLQEVFFNVIDNAYDAMMQRKTDLKEENFEAKLEIFAHPDGKNLNIIVKDTGIGIKPEDHNKIFTPFFTTKATSKKGTGLGMYVIKQIIEENHGGKVRFESRYKQGTQITITLPQYA